MLAIEFACPWWTLHFIWPVLLMDPDWGFIFLFGTILLAKTCYLYYCCCELILSIFWYLSLIMVLVAPVCKAAAVDDLSTGLLCKLVTLVASLCPGTLDVRLVVWQLMLWLDGCLHTTHAMLICLQLWPCGAACGIHLDVYLLVSAGNDQIVLFLSHLQYWCYTCSLLLIAILFEFAKPQSPWT